MSSRGRGGGPAGASAGESVTTSVDEEWAEASASSRLEDEAAGAARADTSLGASSAPRSDDASPSASRPVDVTGASEGMAAFGCKKCAKGSSCWAVHVATQKLSSLRKKALGRRGGERGDPDAVWDEFETLLEAGHRPTVKTYTALAAALGEMGAPEDCEDVLTRMREAGEAPDVKAYNVAVHAWCVGPDPAPREAMRLVDEMRARGVDPVAATFPPLVAAFARLGATDEIESIIKSVESVESREARDEDAVLREYEKIYHAFIAGRLAVDDPRDAEAVLRRWNLEKYDMERVADRKGRISRPVAASYGMIIDHYVRGGEMGEARRLLSQMQWDKVCPSIDIFNMLLRGYLALGNVGAAQDVFRELEGSGTWDMESLGIAPDVASYTSLMDHWAGQGDVVLAEKVLQKMEAKGVAPDDRAFGSLIKAYARARDPARAEAVLARVRAYDAPPAAAARRRPVEEVAARRRAAGRRVPPREPHREEGAAAGEVRGPQGREKEDETRRGALLHRGERVLRRGRHAKRAARRGRDARRAQVVARRAQRPHIRAPRLGLRADRGRRRRHRDRRAHGRGGRVPAPQLGGAERARARLSRVRPPGGARRPHGGEPRRRRARAPARGRALGRAQEEERRGGGRKERREGRSDEGREARGRREGDAKADTGGGAGGAAARRRPPQRRRGVGVLLRRRG